MFNVYGLVHTLQIILDSREIIIINIEELSKTLELENLVLINNSKEGDYHHG